MNDTLTTVVSLTLSGTVLTLGLMALKPLVRNRISKAAQYYVWLLVLLRLVLPVSFDGSAMNRLFAPTEAVPATAGGQGAATVQTLPPQGGGQDPAGENAPAATLPEPISPGTNGHGMSPTAAPAPVLLDLRAFAVQYQVLLWLCGAALYFCRFLVPYLRFTRRVRKTCVPPHPADAEVFRRLCGGTRVRLVCNPYVDTPMQMGLLFPCIVIPQLAFVKNGMGQELRYILRHELTHYRRRDLLFKWVAVLVNSLHWFNPLMILMRREINRACELSCDEAVIRGLDDAGRQRYGNTLLGLAGSKRFPSGIVMTTLCEQKRELKERLLGIMAYRRNTALMMVLSLALFLLLTGCGTVLGATVKDVRIEMPPVSGDGSVQATPAPAPAQPAVPEVPDGVDGVFTNWTSILTMGAAQQEAVFYGVLAGGGRDQNLLTVTRRAEGQYTRFMVLLEAGEQYRAEYDFLAGALSLGYVVSVQGVDFDGDGTDELVINLDSLNSGGWTDTHVLTVKDGAFREILTALNPDGGNGYDEQILEQYSGSLFIRQDYCTGMRAICGEDGRYALQMVWPARLEEDSDSLIYNEFRYDGTGWTTQYPQDQPLLLESADQQRYVRELLDGVSSLPEQAHVYYWPLGLYANLDDKGVMDDMAYLHVLQAEGSDRRFFAVVEAAAHDNPHSPLRKVYVCDQEQGYYLGAADLDGDGLTELAVVLGDGNNGCEIHVLKPEGGELAEVLTIIRGRPTLEAEYAATLLPLDIPWSWCNIAGYEGRPTLAISLAGSGSDLCHVGWGESGWAVMDQPETETGGSQIQPADTDVHVSFNDEFLDHYYSLTQEEQFRYHSLGWLYFDALNARESSVDDPEGYREAATAYIRAYMQQNGVSMPEDAGISVLNDEGTRFYEQGEVKAKLYVTEFTVPDTVDTRRQLAAVVELESDFYRAESFPRSIARIILRSEDPGKRLDIDYPGGEDEGMPGELVARFYIPNVPLEQSGSECYKLRVEQGGFVREAISLEEWMQLSGY